MRQIGALSNERQARKFADYLLTIGITSLVEESTQQWDIWIYDEDRIEKAKEELAAFVENPDDTRYATATETATTIRQNEMRRETTTHKNVVDVRTQWQQPAVSQCPVTFGLICVSIAVAVFSELGNKMDPVLTELLIVPPQLQGGMPDGESPSLLEVMSQGEIWRLVSPIFIHFGFLHIFFNMVWLRELGLAIEARRGSLWFAAIVLGVAITSNLAQYMHAGPRFGGMSGVVFGLFGYIWIKGKCDPSDTLFVPQHTVFWMMGWFVLCATGAVGNVANMAHGGGLITGMATGYASSQLRRIKLNR